ncbi:aspartate--tRNA ligase [soil metagenome]
MTSGERVMSTTMRTHSCGGLRLDDAAAGEVTLCGWVGRRRDHGGVTFIDLRDREGAVQVVFHPETAADAHAAAQRLGAEDVVQVTGSVRARPGGMANPELATGEIEVAAASLQILNASDTPPFPIEDRIEAGEDLRLRYRYLDLRRPEMTNVLAMRAHIVRLMREHMDARGFVEIETPMLTRSTPEGSRDFLVPSRLWPGTFYALPQSPQQLKQLLMVGGQDRYYQIVRCLRDEAARADRGFEFTQLDVEMSFVTQEDLIELIEPLYAQIVREIAGVEVATPFPRLTYAEMMRRYGSDKPDLRYGMELADLAPAFAQTGFNAFARVLDDGGVIKALVAPGAGSFSRKELDRLIDDAKGRGAAGLVWMAVEATGTVRSPVEKFLSSDETAAVLEITGAGEGDLVCIVADRQDRADVALDGLGGEIGAKLELVPDDAWKFCWMVEPPLFEYSDDEGRWVSVHHPFTAPASEDLSPETAHAMAYDLVLNGFEVGGGSIRIHDAPTQRQVFAALQLPPDEVQAQFGHLLRALELGAPPHGGIAMGVDRLVMVMAGKDAIRDVIAFPKSQSGTDPLTGAPAAVDADQLRDLGLALRNEPAGPAKDD